MMNDQFHVMKGQLELLYELKHFELKWVNY